MLAQRRSRRDVVAVLNDEAAPRRELLDDAARRGPHGVRRARVDEHRIDVADEDDLAAHDPGDPVEVDLVAESLELVDGQIVAEDLEQVVAPAAHVEAQPAVEVEAKPLLGGQDDLTVGLGRKGDGQVVRPGEILRDGELLLGPAEIEIRDELIGDDAQELPDEVRPLLDRQEDLESCP